MLRRRTWRWLRSRITSLADRPPQYLQYEVGEVRKIALVPSTRLGRILYPPTFE